MNIKRWRIAISSHQHSLELEKRVKQRNQETNEVFEGYDFEGLRSSVG